jgi:hypothetical protein
MACILGGFWLNGKKFQDAVDAHAKRVSEAKERLEYIDQQLIVPFLNAVQQAGNPGLGFRKVPIAQYQKWRLKYSWRVGQGDQPHSWIDICPNRKWWYYHPGVTYYEGGPLEHSTGPTYETSCTEPGYPYKVPDIVVVNIRLYMVDFMRRHSIKLPSD